MNSFLPFAAVFLFSTGSYAQTSAELTCKAKAKEIAVQTYADCMTTTQNAQIESVRSDYQSELAALKAKYDKKLKDISGGKTTNKSNIQPQNVSTNKINAAPAQVPTKGIAKTLPAKSVTTEVSIKEEAPYQETPVVAVKSDKIQNSESSFEKEAEQNDLQIIDMPTE